MWWPKSPLFSLIAAALLMAVAVPAAAQTRGEADMALQGYYMGGNARSLSDTSGMALRFRTFIPSLGFLSGSLEGYGSGNRLETGNNYVELGGVPWAGRRWTVTGGDFWFSPTLVDF